ncbi:MAG: ABC transporter ATP-binding protein [Bacillota bacterium]
MGVANLVHTSVPLLEAVGLSLQYEADRHWVTAAHQVSFHVQKSDRLVLLGPSGCGKSTILKAIGGYIKPVEGRITLEGRDIDRPGPDRMFVFQEFDQLLPWKTVKQNVIFALTAARRLPRKAAEEQAMDSLCRVNLTAFADAYPHMLSGGMKQRAAIARCLSVKPQIILMDEPFAALDALTRRRMQQETLRLWQESRFTMVFVTHSITEAIRLGTRIVLLTPHPGRVRAELSVEDECQQDERNDEFRKLHQRIQRLLFKDVIDYSI